MPQLLPATFHCPHCQAAVPRLAVWRSGPFRKETCGACRGRYFGSGINGAVGLLCAGLYAFVVTDLLTDSIAWASLWLIAAGCAGVLYTLRAEPLPGRAAWLDVAKFVVPPAALWLALQATAKTASWLGQYMAGC